jgi:hypothetical protein
MKYPSEQISLNEAISLFRKETERPFYVCELLANKVMDLLLQNDPRADRCLQIVAETYEDTESGSLKIAIENSFLTRLGTLMINAGIQTSLLPRLPHKLHVLIKPQMLFIGLGCLQPTNALIAQQV